MDFELSAEQKALKEEWEVLYREMMKGQPEHWRGQHGAEGDAIYGEGWEDAHDEWQRRLSQIQYEKGLLNIHWPKEFGGQALGPVEQVIHPLAKIFPFLIVKMIDDFQN